MRIAQITDLHVDTDGGFMRSFVDANAKLATAVEFLQERAGGLDALLITGDVTNDGRPEQYELLHELLEPLTIPTYLVPGNHDEREAFRAAFSDRPWMPVDGPIDYVIDDHQARLVGIDTTEPDRHDGEFHPEQAEWLDAVLSEQPDRPTVLFGHHPPFFTGLWLFDAMRLNGAERLRDVVARHPQVRLIVSGHVHRPVSAAWGTVALTCSPSTTHQNRCDLHPDEGAGVTDETPMLQIHHLDGDMVITHSMPFERPGKELDFESLIPNWPAARERIAAGPPFSKAEGGMF
jgi:3',5'-cyclic AMP phosphodiesterase CpdA